MYRLSLTSTRFATWLASLVICGCCPAGGWYTFVSSGNSHQFSGLPEDATALLGLADRLSNDTSISPAQITQIDRALAALHKALPKHKPRYEVYWRLARGYFLLTETLKSNCRRRYYGGLGVSAAQRAIAANSKRVEGHYYLALNLAKIAEVSGNLSLVKPMVAAGKRARQIDERFAGAGPLIFLGKTYLTAPAWPLSVGNTDEAIALLERARKMAPRPLTLLFLGQAYYQDQQYKRATKLLQQALEHRKRIAPRWRREAEEILRQIKRKKSPPTSERHQPNTANRRIKSTRSASQLSASAIGCVADN